MTEADSKELKVKEKQEVASAAEQTRSGIVFTPDVDIFETESSIILLADLPGVDRKDLIIDLRDNLLTLSGSVPEAGSGEEQAITSEFQTGTYYRQFTLSEVINQEKIDAQLNDGVLRLTLPKVEKATPRQITVRS